MVGAHFHRAVIEGQGLCFSYNGAPVIRGVDLKLLPCEILGLAGPSGSGKSTLLRLMAGLLLPGAGQVLVMERPLASLRPRQVAKLVALVPQRLDFAPGLTVGETVLAGRYATLGQRIFEARADRESAEGALDMMELSHLARRPAGELSTGERHRLALARAIAAEPQVLLLDDPISALSPDHRSKVMGLLERACQYSEMAVCLVSPDLNLAGMYCQRMALMKSGMILALGPASKVLTTPNLRQTFGMDVMVDRDPLRQRPRVNLGQYGEDRPGRGLAQRTVRAGAIKPRRLLPK